ncbi:MAG: helix-turn-helix transcriptional regulator [Bacteroidales bacterium]|nr:helix-turn-helix transcriptional regulator [Bacteroidales bacterium]
MNHLPEIQKALFQQIKEKLPPNIYFVHEISEVLGISDDSTRRRIRGEKALSFEELYKLSTRFGISIDSLFNVQSRNVIFNCHAVEAEKFQVREWLNVILKDLKRVHAAKEKNIIYAAKDPPFFHYFQFPEIAWFKVFFWQKTLFQFPEFEEKQFRIDDADPDIERIGKHVLAVSTKIPTIEIWNEDTFRIMLRQIEFYWVSGFFAKKDDLLNLCDKTEKWIKHIQKQAEYGFKYIYGEQPDGIENSFQLYQNEVVLNDNTILVNVNGTTMVYLTFNVLSLLITTNPFFCNFVERYMNGLLRKSNLISHTGAKERNRFFNKILHSIDEFKCRVD